MSNSMKASGASRSIPTATAAATGITDDAASGAEKKTGVSEADSRNLTKSDKGNTGKGRRGKAEPLPVSDLLNILQGILRDLQEAGLPVSAVQLPVSEGRPQRVAILMDGVIFYAGKLYTGRDGYAAMVNDGAVELAPQGIKSDPDSSAETSVMDGHSV